MSLLPKEEDVINYLKDNKLSYKEGTSVIAVKMKMSLLSTSNVRMQYLMLNFNDDGIAMIAMNSVTGKLEENNFLVINKDDIKDIKFKKCILCYKMILTTTDAKYKYRVNKITIGAKFQAINLKRILAYFK